MLIFPGYFGLLELAILNAVEKGHREIASTIYGEISTKEIFLVHSFFFI